MVNELLITPHWHRPDHWSSDHLLLKPLIGQPTLARELVSVSGQSRHLPRVGRGRLPLPGLFVTR